MAGNSWTIVKPTASIFTVLLSLCMAAAAANDAAGSEASIRPEITVSEEYNDNIFLTPTDRVEDYITRLIPSVKFAYKAPFWEWDVSYAYDFRLYAHRTIVNDSTPRFNLVNHDNIIREFLLLDVRDEFARTSLTPIRDYTQESISVNQTDTNVFTANPYLLFRPSDDTNVKTGYQIRSLWYKDPSAIDKVEQRAYVDATWETSPRTSLESVLRQTRMDAEDVAYFWTDFSIGAKYEYAEDSFLRLTVGNTWFSSDVWEQTSQIFWDFEINRKFLSYTLSFNTALTYVDDPFVLMRREDRYVVAFQKETERVKFAMSGGLWEYRKVVANNLEFIRYGATASLGYSLTPALKLTYDLTVERFEDKVLQAKLDQKVYTSRYLNGIRLDHPLSETTTIALDYRYTNNYAPQSYKENYQNNRIAAELIKQF